MANLIAQSACDGLLPLTIGSVTVTEVAPAPITSIAPLRGQGAAVSDALQAAFDLPFPDPGQSHTTGTIRTVWAGRGRALLIGAAAPDSLSDIAALTDQSDAQAVVTIGGTDAEAVLARLVPVDLRAAAFPIGRTARTLLGHMQAGVTRTGPDNFEVMVFRSMARTLVHDLQRAMGHVAGRAPGH